MAEKKLLTSIPRTATEEIQIAISEYKGKQFLDMRVFYTKDGGASWNPTQKGITVYPDKLEEFKEAIEQAQKEFEL